MRFKGPTDICPSLDYWGVCVQAQSQYLNGRRPFAKDVVSLYRSKVWLVQNPHQQVYYTKLILHSQVLSLVLGEKLNLKVLD